MDIGDPLSEHIVTLAAGFAELAQAPQGGFAMSEAGQTDAKAAHPPFSRRLRTEPGLRKPDLLESLNANAWAERRFEASEGLFGSLLPRGGRMLVSGQTGAGKSVFVDSLGGALATGTDFLHWSVPRRLTTLILDGEHSGALRQKRLSDLSSRMNGADLARLVIVTVLDDAPYLAERYPDLGEFRPLNTEAGYEWCLRLIEMLGSVDVVIFDNVMSLLEGDKREETSWEPIVPLMRALTAAGIAQIWVDHMTPSGSRVYGTDTKRWQMDTCMTLSPVEDPNGLAFKVAFDKHRHREPSNAEDYLPVTLRLGADGWSRDGEGLKPFESKRRRHLSKGAELALSILTDTLLESGVVGAAGVPANLVSVGEELFRKRYCDRSNPGTQQESKLRAHRRASKELQEAGAISCDQGRVWRVWQ